MESLAIGIDIGGTGTKFGIVDRNGNVLYTGDLSTKKHKKIETFIDGSIMTIADAPWPGFTPDLLSICLVVATQAKGSVLIHQKMFESRLFFVDKLIDMGAQIILCDPHRATVIGLDRRYPLRGIEMTSPDIRAGQALLIEQGALYPALFRLVRQGLLKASWGTSDNNRRAKFYELTVTGRKRLREEVEDWKFMSLSSLREAVKHHPEQYTAWFKLILDHPELNKIAA